MNTDDPLDILRTRQADGQVVLGDRFRVLKKLGEGGMGAVWLAEDIKLNNRKVAVKMLPSVLAANSRAVGQLKQEALLAMQLSHPHIVTLRSFEETEDGAFLVMDYVEGRTLEQELEQSKALSEEQVRKLLGPVADALDYAHSKKVIHRDIKPSNILLQRSEATSALAESDERRWTDSTNNKQRTTNYSPTTAFITDFGVAREMKETFTRVTGRQTSGTLPYMAPEQLRGAAPGPAQDVYGFAATVYEAIAGHPPFHRGQIEYQIINEEAPRLEGCSEGFADNVGRALAKDPASRPARCADIWGEPVSAKENKGRRTGLAALARRVAAIVGVVAVVGLAFYFNGRSEKSVQGSSGSSAPTDRPIPRPAASAPALVVPAIASPVIPSAPAPAAREPSPAEATKDKPFVNSLGMEFVPVPGTEVLFCKWETRVQDFEAFVKETGYDATGGMYSLRNGSWNQHGDTWKSPGFTQGSTHPVCGVSWNDADKLCEWLTKKERTARLLGPNQEYRLPKDWEWSVAVGLNEASEGTPESKDGKIKDVYPWGTAWPPPKGVGNYNSSLNVDSYDRTSPVGSFGGNRFGLCDMGGNLWEWCEDKYKPSEEWRVLRGASWDGNDRDILRCSYRDIRAPSRRNGGIGFRLVVLR